MTMPAMAPPERDPDVDESAASIAWRSGATIVVEVTVWVTTSPEMVTTRVTGEGVANSRTGKLEVFEVGSGLGEEDVDVGGSGVELEVVVQDDD